MASLVLFLLLCAFGHSLTDKNLSRARKFFSYERFKHVSVGEAGVWSVDNDDVVWRRIGSYVPGSLNIRWEQVEGQHLVQLDVGKDVVWGVDAAGQIFVRTGITKDRPAGDAWSSIAGFFIHVSVSQEGHVWVVDSTQAIHRRVGASKNSLGSAWEGVDGSWKQVSVGPAGVWAISTSDQLHYRKGTYGDRDTLGTEWEPLDGGVSYFSSGEKYVIGVNSGNVIHVRLGMSDHSPSGTSWKTFTVHLKMVESFEDQLWGISPDGLIWNAAYKPQWCTC